MRLFSYFKGKSSTNNLQNDDSNITACAEDLLAVWHLLINECRFHPKTLLQMSVACKSIRALLIPIIQKDLTWIFKNNEFRTLSPTRIKASSKSSSHIPSQTTILTLDWSSRSISALPPLLTHLTLGASFTTPLPSLPPSLKHLTFMGDYNHPFDHLPEGLTHLSRAKHLSSALFGVATMYFTTMAEPMFYSSRIHRSNQLQFNHPLDNLPDSLTHLSLELDGGFNHSLDHLPPSLTHLSLYFNPHMAVRYEHSFDHFPSSLTHFFLYIPKYYPTSNPFDHLPSLTHLFVSNSFLYAPQLDHLPSSLTHLYLGCSCASLNLLPNLLFLQMFYFPQIAFAQLPPQLKYLYINNRDNIELHASTLPSSLTHLIVLHTHSLTIDHLPDSLTHLNLQSIGKLSLPALPPLISLKYEHGTALPALPPSLKRLSITENHTLPTTLPSSITHLHLPILANIDELFFSQLPALTHLWGWSISFNYLPPTLKSLSLGAKNSSGSPPPSSFPPSLTHLSLINTFKGNVVLPSTLTHLYLGEFFDQPITLPPFLEYLVIQGEFKKCKSLWPLPSSLYHISAPSTCKVFQGKQLPATVVEFSTKTPLYSDFHYWE